ncbi:hypothetical protein [Amycolatopsis sp. NPDC001319]
MDTFWMYLLVADEMVQSVALTAQEQEVVNTDDVPAARHSRSPGS